MKRPSNRRREKIRRRRRNFIRAILVLIVLGLSFATINIFFKIKDIKIIGQNPYSNSDIIEDLPIKIDDNLIFINKFECERIILEKFPYISQVEISRNLPDTIEINIKKAEEFATIYQDEKYYLIDKTGKVLKDISLSEAKEHARIFGLSHLDLEISQNILKDNPNDEKLEYLFEMVDFFKEFNIINEISEINIDKTYDLSIKYTNKYQINFGSIENFEHKMKFLNEVLLKLAPSDTGIIDLSDTSTARFKPQTIEASPYEGEKIKVPQVAPIKPSSEQEVTNEENLEDEKLHDDEELYD